METSDREHKLSIHRAYAKALNKQRRIGVAMIIITILFCLVETDWTPMLVLLPVGIWLLRSKELLLYIDIKDIVEEEKRLRQEEGFR